MRMDVALFVSSHALLSAGWGEHAESKGINKNVHIINAEKSFFIWNHSFETNVLQA
jgi:hypothetical protein